MNVFKDLIVLECASVLAGPAVGAFFAELGATVIKLEPLQGDVTRSWRLSTESPQSDQNSVSAYFSAVNWGKYSLALDLKQAEGRHIAHQLAQKADIVIANYKPGAAERLQMDYATLSQGNPGLIYAHLTGYGSEDPRTGYDALIQAESGFLYLNGYPETAPAKIPVALMDLLAAHQMKEAILVALLQRFHSQQGDYIEVSLIQSALASLANQASNYLVAEHEPQPMGLEHPNIVPYGTLYTTADHKQMMLAIGSDSQFIQLCALLGQAKLAQNPRFSSNAQRVRFREPLHQCLRPLIAQQNAQDLLKALWQAGIPAGQVNDIPTALNLPAAQAMTLNSVEGQIKGLRTAVFTSQSRQWLELSSPPELGVDTDYVLGRYLSMSESKIQTLREKGLIKLSKV